MRKAKIRKFEKDMEDLERQGLMEICIHNGQREYRLTKLGIELAESPEFNQAFPTESKAAGK